MTEIPEEAVREAEKAWRKAYHAKPFTGDDNSWMRAALAAALPYLRVQETRVELPECTCDGAPVYPWDHRHTCDSWTPAPLPKPTMHSDDPPPAPRPVVDREALQAAIAGATGHISELDQHEEGEWEEGCTACAGWGYPCATLSAAVNAVLALLPTEEDTKGEGS